jgi:DNA-binding NarL/FixJ family response regulator
MIRILIVDDHAILRAGLKEILSQMPDPVVADEAGNDQEAMEKIHQHEYDLVLLDIALPGRSGIEVLKDLKSERPALPVLILSMYPEEQYAMRALTGGASGYLTKQSAPDELITAIRKVLRGAKYVSASMAESLVSYLDVSAEKIPHQALSDREYQVMCMIASGKTVKQIADELCLSVKTISTHRERILRKMKLKNNAEITRYAIKHGLVE